MTIDIKSMGYVRVTATDMDRWQVFAEQVLGLMKGKGPNPEALYYRIDAVTARLVVTPGDVDEMSACGWEMADPAALDAAREHLTAAGIEWSEGTPEELAERRVESMIRFSDPWNNVMELFCGITYEKFPAVTPFGHNFVTGDEGMGHIVVPVEDDEAALDYYTNTLGFRLRDSFSLPGEIAGREPGTKVWLRFMGVNARHHSLAFLPFPNPSKCVHIMLEVDSIDHVGRALERVKKHDFPISMGLGRHMNDEMISFYVKSPSGFDVEFGTAGLKVDDRTWVARSSTATSYWGHKQGG